MTTTQSPASVHPFTAAGLGAAPFKYVGVEVQDLCYGQVILNREEYQRTGVLLSTKPGGSCAYCGTYIVQMFNVRSADGKEFHVGSDCVAKVAPESPKLAAVVKRKVSQIATLRKHSRDVARIASAREQLAVESVREALRAQPHPYAVRAALGETALDYADFLFERGGKTGRLRAAALIRKLVEEKDGTTKTV